MSEKPMIIVTGSNGQLGSEIAGIVAEYHQFGFSFFDRAGLDISNNEELKTLFEQLKPAYFINCAAYTAVDKAELDPAIAKLPRVNFLQQSAFALKPEEFPQRIDWLLCDVACYPQRTYDLITQWLASGKVGNMIFTIKLQGETDFAMLKKFQEIPGARVIHLLHNKHEVTFFHSASPH